MIVLGLSGAFGRCDRSFIPNLPVWFFHDAAAALVRDGEVVAAVEEERISRAKHTNAFPIGAAKAVLRTARIDSNEIDAFAFFFREDYTDLELALQYAENPAVPIRFGRELLRENLAAGLHRDVPDACLHFVDHHSAHAHLAYRHSGFSEALVAILDGNGEDHSVSIYSAVDGRFDRLHTEPPEKSFGHFYCLASELLGYGRFDEYKVMGLAPYGDPVRLRNAFLELVEFQANGQYRLEVGQVRSHFLKRGLVPRRRGAAFEAIHADFAAALQETMDRLAVHVLGHWQRVTGLQNLCLAGGVAQNCSMNGQIAATGIFRKMFVHPSSHDAGAAVGAALIVEAQETTTCQRRPHLIPHVAWGMAIDPEDVDTLLSRWSNVFEEIATTDFIATAAGLLAQGEVIGWARGRMEFGPRALGQRSIFADPRPLSNRERINAIIKKRENYRPFAPMVLVKHAAEWFELPNTSCNLDFMVYTVPVRPQWRKLLGAITHVDGSARLQTVSDLVLPEIASLLEAFNRLSGVPILLNTSFNVDAEPIVGTAGEALLCFLASDLDALVIDDRVVRRRRPPPSFWLDLVLMPRPDVVLTWEQDFAQPITAKISFSFTGGRSLTLPRPFAELLAQVDGTRTFRACGFDQSGLTDSIAADLIQQLIAMRFVRIVGLDAPTVP